VLQGSAHPGRKRPARRQTALGLRAAAEAGIKRCKA